MNFQRLSAFGIAVIVSATLATGCGKSREDELFGEADGEGGGGGAAKVDPATAATIAGSVAFEGPAPAPTPVDMSSDGVCASDAQSAALGAGDIVIKDGKLGNVFVYVSKGLEGKRYEAPKEAATLDQKGCRYVPHVVGLVAGQTLKISNSDPTLHNVHPTPKKNKGFNQAQPNQGMVFEKTFNEEEVMIPFSCDVHGWMRSYVGVLTHPFFGVSGDNGAFTLNGVPPGTYTVTAWHEKFGQQEQQVTVGAKESKNITFTFKAS